MTIKTTKRIFFFMYNCVLFSFSIVIIIKNCFHNESDRQMKISFPLTSRGEGGGGSKVSFPNRINFLSLNFTLSVFRFIFFLKALIRIERCPHVSSARNNFTADKASRESRADESYASCKLAVQ